jgi:hypothetical protein
LPIEQCGQRRRIEHRRLDVLHETVRQQLAEPVLGPLALPALPDGPSRMGLEPLDRLEQRIDPLSGRGFGLHDRRTPLSRSERMKAQHRLD